MELEIYLNIPCFLFFSDIFFMKIKNFVSSKILVAVTLVKFPAVNSKILGHNISST